MGHPLIDEFCRAHQFDPSFLRRCQRVFREEVQPLIDERDQLEQRVRELQADLDEATAPKRAKAAV